MKPPGSTQQPLSPVTLHVLLALTSGDQHGYAIMQEVLRQSEGRYKLWPGTLYDNLQKLVREGWVHELGAKAGDDDPRRRYYRLTKQGASTLASEIDRLEAVVREAKVQLSNFKPRRT